MDICCISNTGHYLLTVEVISTGADDLNWVGPLPPYLRAHHFILLNPARSYITAGQLSTQPSLYHLQHIGWWWGWLLWLNKQENRIEDLKRRMPCCVSCIFLTLDLLWNTVDKYKEQKELTRAINCNLSNEQPHNMPFFFYKWRTTDPLIPTLPLFSYWVPCDTLVTKTGTMQWPTNRGTIVSQTSMKIKWGQ